MESLLLAQPHVTFGNGVSVVSYFAVRARELDDEGACDGAKHSAARRAQIAWFGGLPRMRAELDACARYYAAGVVIAAAMRVRCTLTVTCDPPQRDEAIQ